METRLLCLLRQTSRNITRQKHNRTAKNTMHHTILAQHATAWAELHTPFLLCPPSIPQTTSWVDVWRCKHCMCSLKLRTSVLVSGCRLTSAFVHLVDFQYVIYARELLGGANYLGSREWNARSSALLLFNRSVNWFYGGGRSSERLKLLHGHTTTTCFFVSVLFFYVRIY